MITSLAHFELIWGFLVPANVEKFGYAFAGAIRFHFKENLRLSTWIESKMFGSPPDGTTFERLSVDWNKNSRREVNAFWKSFSLFYSGTEASWERVLITFEKYATLFKKQYGCVPVLILDNCDRLAKGDSKTLEILQDSAKRAVDNSTWVAVFVMAVGNTLEQMEGLEFLSSVHHEYDVSCPLRFSALSRSLITTLLANDSDRSIDQFISLFFHLQVGVASPERHHS